MTDPIRISVINGPNLNMLGTREPNIYGHDTLADIEARCRVITDEAGHQLDWMQSNSEGDLITTIQQANGVADWIIINAAGLTHTSVALRDALAGVDIQPPAVPLIANVRAEAVIEPGAIRRLLVEQVTGTVRWRESIANMAEAGVSEFWEIGAGKALSGMIRRIARDATVRNIGVPADVVALRG